MIAKIKRLHETLYLRDHETFAACGVNPDGMALDFSFSALSNSYPPAGMWRRRPGRSGSKRASRSPASTSTARKRVARLPECSG